MFSIFSHISCQPYVFDEVHVQIFFSFIYWVIFYSSVQSLSRVWLFVSSWIAALQASLSMGFSKQEYWSGLLCPSPRDLPNPGIEPMSLMSPALAGRFFTTGAIWKTQGSVSCSVVLLRLFATSRIIVCRLLSIHTRFTYIICSFINSLGNTNI